MEAIDLKKYRSFITGASPVRKKGEVTRITGMIIEGSGPATPLGSLCAIYSNIRKAPMEAQVVGFRDKRTLLMPLEDIVGIEPGNIIESLDEFPAFNVSQEILGRVIDGNGKPLDNKGPIPIGTNYPLNGTPLNPLERAVISKPLDVGVRAINGLATCARGQRMGILGGKGVGKSILLGMIARNADAEINVVAMIGEKGCEVKKFVDENLGPDGLKKSVVVAAAADSPALVRVRCALIATTIAEFFRDQGKNVILMMDSITRLALAQREIGLSVGEPPTARGFTPSVFSLLSKLLERAGTCKTTGTITGLYTVLTEEDDLNEPISDAMLDVLDGHIALSRQLASHNHYPAIDPLNSVSRLMADVTADDHHELAMKIKDIYAICKEAEGLISIGAYAKGSNPKIDRAMEKYELIIEYMRQEIMESVSIHDSIDEMKKIIED